MGELIKYYFNLDSYFAVAGSKIINLSKKYLSAGC